MRTPKLQVSCRMPQPCCMGFASCVLLSVEGGCVGQIKTCWVGSGLCWGCQPELWGTQGQQQCWGFPLLTLPPPSWDELPAQLSPCKSFTRTANLTSSTHHSTDFCHWLNCAVSGTSRGILLSARINSWLICLCDLSLEQPNLVLVL